MKINKLISACVLSLGLLCPVLAAAGSDYDLTIVNSTNQDSTSIINGGPCSSTVLGASGVTKAHSTNVVSAMKLSLACIMNKENCKADIYMTANCTGPKISTVLFSTSTGIKSFTRDDSSYQLSGSGFKAEIKGGA